jgi:hypothetical protein
MRAIPRNPNPNLGFRGNPDGHQGTALVDYGVYANPVHRALLLFGFDSDVITYGNDAMIKQYIARGWPVVVWITYALQDATPRLAESNGVQFVLVPHEHAVLAVGFDSGSLWVNDPWTAKQTHYRWRDFNRAWGYFGDMALAVQPCIVPAAVTGLTISSLTPDGITWTWNAARHADRYQVNVTRYGKQARLVSSSVQPDTTFTFPNPLANKVYEISVQALSSCGAVSQPTRLSALIRLPVTPTPSEGGVTVTPSPAPTAAATLSPTAATSATVPPQPTATP